MEVLSGVASVIAVVTLALQSTKVIYEVASSMNHGSDDINRLAKATENLEKLLKAIKRLAEHAERTNSVAEGKLLDDLKPLVDQCVNALREIPPKLIQMQKDSKDGRLRKVKKYAKRYLDTGGVAEIWNTVNHYVELLGSFLGNASVDVGLYNAEELQHLHDGLSAASQDYRSQMLRVEEVLRDQRALAQAGQDKIWAEVHQGSLDAGAAANTQIQDIAELRTWQKHFGKAATDGYDSIRTDFRNMRAIIDDKSHQATLKSEALITEVREGMSEATSASSAQIQEARRMKVEVTQELHSISDRLKAIPSIASEQLSTLQSLVEMLSHIQLEARTGHQNSLKNTIGEAYSTGSGRCNDPDLSFNSEIKNILARVCHFAETVKTCRYSKEAQSVIEDISKLLGLVMEQLSTMGPSRDELPMKRKGLCDYHYSEVETAVQSVDDLRKAKRALTASKRVRISSQDLIQADECEHSAMLLPSDSPKSLLEVYIRRRVPDVNLQSTTHSWTLQHARLDAIFKRFLLPDAGDQDTESADEEFAAKLLITPVSVPSSNFQIVIDLASKIHQNRITYFTPMLTFRAMIPNDSEVFRVVKGGSVKKLKKLLSSGAASLGDCDSMGRSLLNFALFKCRRKMTKYLIQSGADVDTLEPHLDFDLLVKPLNMFQSWPDVDSADEDLERVEGCYSVLLDAGSDISSVITSDVDHEAGWLSAFTEALDAGTLAKTKALIDLGEPFISLESTGDNNDIQTIPLLYLAYVHCHNLSSNLQIPDKIAILLNRGANAKARNPQGETCLHQALSKHYHTESHCWCYCWDKIWRHSRGTKDIVILLISAGADVCAADEYGWSVSDVAIHSGQEVLWTEALKYCGIDIKDVLARPNVNPAHSTALSSQYSQPSRSVTSKTSLEEYLEWRKAFSIPDESNYDHCCPEFSSSEDDDESDHDKREDDGSENEELAEETSMITEMEQNEFDDENHKVPVRYEDSVVGGKAKLD